ncbi:MAG: nucleotidyltransferase family protein [Desulfobacterales bacterium]|nr:nucleotidyltransferase family protein [Desulfobacterales bacterium]
MNTFTNDEIMAYLKTNKKSLYEQFGVIRIGLFGSYAHGRPVSSSDIDMVVELEGTSKNIHNFFRLKRFLENEFGKKVDLGFEQSLKPLVRESIREQIIYA